MSNMPKISVIIPVYNHGDELTACLASLQTQTEQDFEVIIVDDGSDVAPVIPANAGIHFASAVPGIEGQNGSRLSPG